MIKVKQNDEWVDIPLVGFAAQSSITYAPAFVGQIAIVGSDGYIATGTKSANDWKLITGIQTVEGSTIASLIPDVYTKSETEQLIKDCKSYIDNRFYRKDEVYTKYEIDEMLKKLKE